MAKIVMKHISEIEYEDPQIKIVIDFPIKTANIVLNFVCQNCNGYGDSRGGICRTCNGTCRDNKVLNLDNIRIDLGDDVIADLLHVLEDLCSTKIK